MKHHASSLKTLENRILKSLSWKLGLMMKVAMHSRVLLLFILVTSLPYLSLAQQQDIANSGDDFSSQVYRQALVIENTSYQNTKDSPPSPNTTNQVSDTLKSLGFHVTTLGNAKQRETEKVIRETLEADSRILKDPGIQVGVSALADSSVNFVVRPWCKTSEYWDVYFDSLKAIKIALDENNIEIPFPQMDVHLNKVD